MSDHTTHLMEHVYQYFLNLYQPDGEISDEVFLSFEPIGRGVDLESYKLRPTDTDFFPPIALEEVSELVDDVPAIDTDVFLRTDKSVSEFYENFILVGATAGTSDQGEVNLFNHVKAKAQQKFDAMKINLYDVAVKYNPTHVNPEDWYDPSEEDQWISYSYQMGRQQSSNQGSPPRVSLNPAIRSWQWQVLPKEFTPILNQPQLLKTVSLSKALKNETVQAELNHNIATQQLARERFNTVSLSASQLESLRVANDFQIAQPSMVQSALQGQAERFVARSVLSEAAGRQTPFAHQTGAISQAISPAVLNSIQQQLANPQVTNQVASSATIASTTAVLLNKTYSRSVESDHLKLSFEYCIVHCDRPWLSQSVLNTKGWYVPGFKAGEFSTGMIEGNEGLFPALPIAFIVIKDLQISGWSESEFEYVQDSMAFGPFSLLSRELKNGVLINKGMQVIGWISQVMPFMPPLSDPNPD